MKSFTHTASDPWHWRRAVHTDVEAIMDLMALHYQSEIAQVFDISRTRCGYNLHRAILEQSYAPHETFLGVAECEHRVIAWHWLTRAGYQIYSNDEMATAEYVHMDLSLSARTRIRLCAQILEQWQAWCQVNSIPVLVSTTIRQEQTAFMRLHERMGFQVNGSFAYKRIAS